MHTSQLGPKSGHRNNKPRNRHQTRHKPTHSTTASTSTTSPLTTPQAHLRTIVRPLPVSSSPPSVSPTASATHSALLQSNQPIVNPIHGHLHTKSKRHFVNLSSRLKRTIKKPAKNKRQTNTNPIKTSRRYYEDVNELREDRAGRKLWDPDRLMGPPRATGKFTKGQEGSENDDEYSDAGDELPHFDPQLKKTLQMPPVDGKTMHRGETIFLGPQCTDVFVTLHSTMGDRPWFIRSAIEEISQLPETTVTGISPMYATPGHKTKGIGAKFTVALRLTTTIVPRSLILEFDRIQLKFGKNQITQVNADQSQNPHLAKFKYPINIDLITFGSLLLDQTNQFNNSKRRLGTKFQQTHLDDVFTLEIPHRTMPLVEVSYALSSLISVNPTPCSSSYGTCIKFNDLWHPRDNLSLTHYLSFPKTAKPIYAITPIFNHKTFDSFNFTNLLQSGEFTHSLRPEVLDLYQFPSLSIRSHLPAYRNVYNPYSPTDTDLRTRVFPPNTLNMASIPTWEHPYISKFRNYTQTLIEDEKTIKDVVSLDDSNGFTKRPFIRVGTDLYNALTMELIPKPSHQGIDYINPEHNVDITSLIPFPLTFLMFPLAARIAIIQALSQVVQGTNIISLSSFTLDPIVDSNRSTEEQIYSSNDVIWFLRQCIDYFEHLRFFDPIDYDDIDGSQQRKRQHEIDVLQRFYEFEVKMGLKKDINGEDGVKLKLTDIPKFKEYQNNVRPEVRVHTQRWEDAMGQYQRFQNEYVKDNDVIADFDAKNYPKYNKYGQNQQKPDIFTSQNDTNYKNHEHQTGSDTVRSLYKKKLNPLSGEVETFVAKDRDGKPITDPKLLDNPRFVTSDTIDRYRDRMKKSHLQFLDNRSQTDRKYLTRYIQRSFAWDLANPIYISDRDNAYKELGLDQIDDLEKYRGDRWLRDEFDEWEQYFNLTTTPTRYIREKMSSMGTRERDPNQTFQHILSGVLDPHDGIQTNDTPGRIGQSQINNPNNGQLVIPQHVSDMNKTQFPSTIHLATGSPRTDPTQPMTTGSTLGQERTFKEGLIQKRIQKTIEKYGPDGNTTQHDITKDSKLMWKDESLRESELVRFEMYRREISAQIIAYKEQLGIPLDPENPYERLDHNPTSSSTLVPHPNDPNTPLHLAPLSLDDQEEMWNMSDLDFDEYQSGKKVITTIHERQKGQFPDHNGHLNDPQVSIDGPNTVSPTTARFLTDKPQKASYAPVPALPTPDGGFEGGLPLLPPPEPPKLELKSLSPNDRAMVQSFQKQYQQYRAHMEQYQQAVQHRNEKLLLDQQQQQQQQEQPTRLANQSQPLLGPQRPDQLQQQQQQSQLGPPRPPSSSSQQQQDPTLLRYAPGHVFAPPELKGNRINRNEIDSSTMNLGQLRDYIHDQMPQNQLFSAASGDSHPQLMNTYGNNGYVDQNGDKMSRTDEIIAFSQGNIALQEHQQHHQQRGAGSIALSSHHGRGIIPPPAHSTQGQYQSYLQGNQKKEAARDGLLYGENLELTKTSWKENFNPKQLLNKLSGVITAYNTKNQEESLKNYQKENRVGLDMEFDGLNVMQSGGPQLGNHNNNMNKGQDFNHSRQQQIQAEYDQQSERLLDKRIDDFFMSPGTAAEINEKEKKQQEGLQLEKIYEQKHSSQLQQPQHPLRKDNSPNIVTNPVKKDGNDSQLQENPPQHQQQKPQQKPVDRSTIPLRVDFEGPKTRQFNSANFNTSRQVGRNVIGNDGSADKELMEHVYPTHEEFNEIRRFGKQLSPEERQTLVDGYNSRHGEDAIGVDDYGRVRANLEHVDKLNQQDYEKAQQFEKQMDDYEKGVGNDKYKPKRTLFTEPTENDYRGYEQYQNGKAGSINKKQGKKFHGLDDDDDDDDQGDNNEYKPGQSIRQTGPSARTMELLTKSGRNQPGKYGSGGGPSERYDSADEGYHSADENGSPTSSSNKFSRYNIPPQQSPVNGQNQQPPNGGRMTPRERLAALKAQQGNQERESFLRMSESTTTRPSSRGASSPSSSTSKQSRQAQSGGGSSRGSKLDNFEVDDLDTIDRTHRYTNPATSSSARPSSNSYRPTPQNRNRIHIDGTGFQSTSSFRSKPIDPFFSSSLDYNSSKDNTKQQSNRNGNGDNDDDDLDAETKNALAELTRQMHEPDFLDKMDEIRKLNERENFDESIPRQSTNEPFVPLNAIPKYAQDRNDPAFRQLYSQKEYTMDQDGNLISTEQQQMGNKNTSYVYYMDDTGTSINPQPPKSPLDWNEEKPTLLRELAAFNPRLAEGRRYSLEMLEMDSEADEFYDPFDPYAEQLAETPEELAYIRLRRDVEMQDYQRGSQSGSGYYGSKYIPPPPVLTPEQRKRRAEKRSQLEDEDNMKKQDPSNDFKESSGKLGEVFAMEHGKDMNNAGQSRSKSSPLSQSSSLPPPQKTVEKGKSKWDKGFSYNKADGNAIKAKQMNEKEKAQLDWESSLDRLDPLIDHTLDMLHMPEEQRQDIYNRMDKMQDERQKVNEFNEKRIEKNYHRTNTHFDEYQQPVTLNYDTNEYNSDTQSVNNYGEFTKQGLKYQLKHGEVSNGNTKTNNNMNNKNNKSSSFSSTTSATPQYKNHSNLDSDIVDMFNKGQPKYGQFQEGKENSLQQNPQQAHQILQGPQGDFSYQSLPSTPSPTKHDPNKPKLPWKPAHIAEAEHRDRQIVDAYAGQKINELFKMNEESKKLDLIDDLKFEEDLLKLLPQDRMEQLLRHNLGVDVVGTAEMAKKEGDETQEGDEGDEGGEKKNQELNPEDFVVEIPENLLNDPRLTTKGRRELQKFRDDARIKRNTEVLQDITEMKKSLEMTFDEDRHNTQSLQSTNLTIAQRHAYSSPEVQERHPLPPIVQENTAKQRFYHAIGIPLSHLYPKLVLHNSVTAPGTPLLCVHTASAEGMLRGVLSGADLIHDYGFGGQDERSFMIQQALDVPVIAGHMRGNLSNFNSNDVLSTYNYGYDQVQDVKQNDVFSSNARRGYSNPFFAGIAFDFEQYLHHSSKSGVAMYNTILDPGIGLSKTHQIDLALPNHLTSLLPPSLPLPMMFSTTKVPSITRLLHTTELTMSQNLTEVAKFQETKVNEVKRYFSDPRNHNVIRAKIRQNRKLRRGKYDPMDEAIKAAQITAEPQVSFSFSPTNRVQVMQSSMQFGPHGHRQFDPWTYKHTITKELTDLIKHLKYTYKNEQDMLENVLVSSALNSTPQNGLQTQIEMYTGTSSRLAIVQSNCPRKSRVSIELGNIISGIDMVVEEGGLDVSLANSSKKESKKKSRKM